MSNLTQRILTAAVAIPLILIICIYGKIAFLLFVMVISSVALSEYYHLAEVKGAHPQKILGIIAGCCISCTFYHERLRTFIVSICQSMGMEIPFPSQSQLLMIVLLAAIVVFSLIELFRNNGSPTMNLAATILGMMYISMFFGTFVGLRELFSYYDATVYQHIANIIGAGNESSIYRFGGYTVISLFAMIWICDTAAFHFGVAFGKHKLFPRVSPNKSWEGSMFGFIFAVATAVAAKYLVLEYLSLPQAVVIGCIVGIFGQLGDLIESLMKRDAGVKDSSNIIPGHGGAFDRFDSLLLTAPLVYLYIDFVVF